MSCHEIAALRLGLMNVLGAIRAEDREHEIAELGDLLHRPGPLCSTANATCLSDLALGYSAALGDLEADLLASGVAPQRDAYLRTLMVLNRKVELELAAQIEGLSRLSRDLDAIHDFVHQVHPQG